MRSALMCDWPCAMSTLFISLLWVSNYVLDFTVKCRLYLRRFGTVYCSNLHIECKLPLVNNVKRYIQATVNIFWIL